MFERYFAPIFINDFYQPREKFQQIPFLVLFSSSTSSRRFIGAGNLVQGCQIFLGTKYQNGKKYTKYVTVKYTKMPKNKPNGSK
jgi:hypothetical protein